MYSPLIFLLHFYAQCSKIEDLFKPFNRIIKLLLAYGHMHYKRSYQHRISIILDEKWMVLCWSQSEQLLKFQKHAWYWSNVDETKFLSAASVKKNGLPCTELYVVLVAWTQSSFWIYGINLAVQCVRCIYFCVVSCYSTIKIPKNDY